jgi:hypothetical protein
VISAEAVETLRRRGRLHRRADGGAGSVGVYALECVAHDDRDFTSDEPTTCSDDEQARFDVRLTRAVSNQPESAPLE